MPNFIWTENKPTVPGFYWVRNPMLPYLPDIISVHKSDISDPYVLDDKREWAGPIPDAVEADEANDDQRIEVFLDGDMWCALRGKDLQEGESCFGRSPMEALGGWLALYGPNGSALKEQVNES